MPINLFFLHDQDNNDHESCWRSWIGISEGTVYREYIFGSEISPFATFFYKSVYRFFSCAKQKPLPITEKSGSPPF